MLVAGSRDGDPGSVPGLHAASRGLRPVDGVPLGCRARPDVLAREQASLVVVHRQATAEHLRQHVTDLDDTAAVKEYVGEQVVRVGCALGGLRARTELCVGLVRRGNGSTGLLEEARVLQGDRGVRRERGQQRHLARGERPDRAVHGEQRTDDLALDGERHPEDGADLLALHGGVDVVAVHEALVSLVVLGEVRRPRLSHQPEQPGAERQPQLAELGGERTVGHLHVRRPLELVVERQVGHVGVQQLPRPPDDGGQDRVEVADRGEIPSGLEERGQLGLPAALALHLLMDPHGECMPLAKAGQLLGTAPRDLRLSDHEVEVLPRRPRKQHLEKLRGDLHAPILPVVIAGGCRRVAPYGPWLVDRSLRSLLDPPVVEVRTTAGRARAKRASRNHTPQQPPLVEQRAKRADRRDQRPCAEKR